MRLYDFVKRRWQNLQMNSHFGRIFRRKSRQSSSIRMTANILLDVNASPLHSRTILFYSKHWLRESLTHWRRSRSGRTTTLYWGLAHLDDGVCVSWWRDKETPTAAVWLPLEMSQIELKGISKEPLEKTDIVDLLQSLSYLWIRLLTLFGGVLWRCG